MRMKDNDESFFNVLSNIIDEAFSKVFTEKKEGLQESNAQYMSIKEYTAGTGKRFRMSKDQKERGITREEAFAEIHLTEEK